MITIVNYGVGNIQAFANIYKRLGIATRFAASAADLADAEKVILPGVGAFDWAMQRLNDSGMRAALDQVVLVRRRPALGVCVGMQMMGRNSEEGKLPGLSWVDGEVKRFDERRFRDRTHLPHMGWNDVTPRKADGLFRGLGDGARFYFLHSYYFAAKREEHVVARTDYYGAYASAINSQNVYGVQFHPEKSHQWGIELLKNFAEMEC